MADTQEKVAADAAMEVPKEEEPRVQQDVPEETEKPKRGRRSGSKKYGIDKLQEEAQSITKGLPGTEVEGRRMTRSSVRGTPPVTPSPKKERKSAGASGGGGRGGKRGRQRKLVKEEEEEDEEEEELEEGEKKAKAPKKAEENGDDAHGEEEEEAPDSKKDSGDTEKKDEDEKMEVDDAKTVGTSSKDDKKDEVKPVVNNTEKEPASETPKPAEEEKKAPLGTPQESAPKANSSEDGNVNNVNNVEAKVDEGKQTSEKSVNENSITEKKEETGSNENEAPSEDAAPAKGVAQEPVAVAVSQ